MYIPEIWLGSDRSRDEHLLTILAYQRELPQILFQEQQLHRRLEEEGMSFSEYLASEIMSVEGNVGIVTISGALEARESYRQLWSNVCSYPTIMTAIKGHLENPTVQTILTVWDTPGGDVSGVSDMGDFITDAGKVKPVYAWTGAHVLSAGYWGAACCKQVRAARMAEVGSIGVVAKFRSYSRMLEEAGIDTLIARSAELKAVLQPEEPISDSKKAYLQNKVDELHAFFVDHISKHRKKISSDSSVWASGESFFAERAIEIGLVDGPPITLNAFVTQLQASIAKKAQNPENSIMNKSVVLSGEQIAQLMLGVPVPGVSFQDPAVDPDADPATTLPTSPTTASDGASASAEAQAADPSGDSAPGPGGAAASDSGGSAPAPGLSEADLGVMTYLKGRLSEMEKEATTAAVDKAQLLQQLESLKEVESLLRPIAMQSLTWLQVALGQTPTPSEGLSVAKLSELHAQTKALMESRMPSGRVTAAGDEDGREPKELSLEEQRVRRLHSVI